MELSDPIKGYFLLEEQRYSRLAALPFEQIGRSTTSGSTRSFIKSIKEILSHRGMLYLFIRRDLKSKYKDSTLGFAWTLVKPLTQLLIFWVVVGKFLGAERGIPVFAIYIFTGLTAYGLFQEITQASTNSILSNAGLVKKVYVPRELFPLSASGTAMFNFLIQFAILIIANILLGNMSWGSDLLYLLPATLILVLFGLSLGLIFSAWNVYLRDISYLVDVLLMLLLWASPILYSWQMVKDVMLTAGLPWLLDIYTYNPITIAIIGFQKAIWGTEKHGLTSPENFDLRMIVSVAIGLVFLVIAQRIFTRLQGNFAQEL